MQWMTVGQSVDTDLFLSCSLVWLLKCSSIYTHVLQGLSKHITCNSIPPHFNHNFFAGLLFGSFWCNARLQWFHERVRGTVSRPFVSTHIAPLFCSTTSTKWQQKSSLLNLLVSCTPPSIWALSTVVPWKSKWSKPSPQDLFLGSGRWVQCPP